MEITLMLNNRWMYKQNSHYMKQQYKQCHKTLCVQGLGCLPSTRESWLSSIPWLLQDTATKTSEHWQVPFNTAHLNSYPNVCVRIKSQLHTKAKAHRLIAVLNNCFRIHKRAQGLKIQTASSRASPKGHPPLSYLFLIPQRWTSAFSKDT